MKKFWRCHICNDIHYGDRPPGVCPTCAAKNAFCQVDRQEAMSMQAEAGEELGSEDQMIVIWQHFADASEEFKLSEEQEDVRLLAMGILENKAGKGLKYCPCRITSGDPGEDLKLVCPCNFKAQRAYRDDGCCWCGLFVRR